jgi:hypothetical protein
MKKVMFAAASALALLAAAPVLADEMADASKMSCGDFAKMDKEGMMKATTEMSAMAMEEAKKAGKEMAAMSDEDSMAMIMKGCDGKPDMMAMDAMHGDM